MTDAIQETYDQIPYASEPITVSHPAHLAAIAVLFGHQAPLPSRARILELGSARGDNILGIAASLPKSTCLGIDLSPRQIEQGQVLINKSNLKNVKLECGNILELDVKQLGQFDYIIAHGLFSWVSKSVQEKILALCQSCLSENGIAYISYNTFPGWHVRIAIREMMLYQSRNETSQTLRPGKSRAVLEFMAQALNKNSAYGSLMLEELRHPLSMPDWYLTHDFIAEYNDPMYFHQFMRLCQSHDLRYLGDAEVPMMFPQELSPAVQKQILQISTDGIEREQYTDFVRNRMFRRSILVKSSAAIADVPQKNQLSKLYLASPLSPTATTSVDQIFRHPNGGAIRSPSPQLRVAIEIFQRLWPCSVSYNDLLSELKVTGSSGLGSSNDQLLCEGLLTCYKAGLLELTPEPAVYTHQLCTPLIASPLARAQAVLNSQVTSLRHESVQLNNLEQQVLTLLDGSLAPEHLKTQLGINDSQLNNVLEKLHRSALLYGS